MLEFCHILRIIELICINYINFNRYPIPKPRTADMRLRLRFNFKSFTRVIIIIMYLSYIIYGFLF